MRWFENGELESQIETLRADPKMRSADAIKLAADAETQACEDFQAAEQAIADASERLVRRRTAKGEANRQAESQLEKSSDVYRRSSDLAAVCDLKVQHEKAFSSLKLPADHIIDCSIGES